MANKGFFFDTDDFLSSTAVAVMTPAEAGGYIFLLAHMWNQGCALPDDDAVLGTLSRLGAGWKKAAPKIRPCLIEHPTKPGHLTSPKLLEKYERFAEYLDKQSAKGKASAAKRTGNRNATTVEPRLNHGATAGVTGDPTGGQLLHDSMTKNNPLPLLEIEEPTDPDDRLKFLLERKVARLSALPWGTIQQEERARETLTAMHADGEAAALAKLVTAYRWRPEGKTYQPPASMADLLFRLSKSEEAEPAGDDGHNPAEKVWTLEELRARARR